MNEQEIAEMAKQYRYPVLLVLERHAESLRNQVKKRNKYLPDDGSAAMIKGIADMNIPITREGIVQARLTGQALRERYGTFDCVYDSGHLRTVQTRTYGMEAYSEEELANTKIRSSHLIVERLSGYTYDMDTEEANRAFPYLARHFELFGPFYAEPPGGESQYHVSLRTLTFYERVRSHRAGKKVWVVDHGGTQRCLIFNVEGRSAQEFMDQYYTEEPPNCGITVYRFSPETKRMKREALNQIFYSVG